MTPPTDTEILNAMRSGHRSAPELVRYLYGLDTEDNCAYMSKRAKLNGKLRTLEKQGFVKRAGLELFERRYVMKFDVIE